MEKALKFIIKKYIECILNKNRPSEDPLSIRMDKVKITPSSTEDAKKRLGFSTAYRQWLASQNEINNLERDIKQQTIILSV